VSDDHLHLFIRLLTFFVAALVPIYAARASSTLNRYLGVAAAYSIAVAGLFVSRQSVAESFVMGAAFVLQRLASGRWHVDDVIQPHKTRPWLINALQTARSKRVHAPQRKHGNIPL
jgi:hypothetical protein